MDLLDATAEPLVLTGAPRTGSETHFALRHHRYEVSCVEFVELGAKGIVLVSGDTMGMLKLWNLRTRHPMATIECGDPRRKGKACVLSQVAGMHVCGMPCIVVQIRQYLTGNLDVIDLTSHELPRVVLRILTNCTSFCRFSVHGDLICAGTGQFNTCTLYKVCAADADEQKTAKSRTKLRAVTLRSFDLRETDRKTKDNAKRGPDDKDTRGMLMDARLFSWNGSVHAAMLSESGCLDIICTETGVRKFSGRIVGPNVTTTCFDFIVKSEGRIQGIVGGPAAMLTMFALDTVMCDSHSGRRVEKVQITRLYNIELKNEGVNRIQIRKRDCKLFATAGWDNRLRLFSFRKTFKLLKVRRRHSDVLNDICFDPISNFFASAGKDCKIVLESAY